MAVPDRVAAAFRCPACAGPVRGEPAGLTCAAGHVSSFQFGYVDASANDDQPDADTRRTLDSFGYEWSHFPAVQPEDHEYWRRYFADVDLTSLQGRLGLDAGCGKARFSRFTAHHLGDLVAVDASKAVVTAAANLADEPNTVVVRADLRSMPFAPGSFGFVSCLGVLHHLPDPRAGFDALVDLLAPEGLLLL
ncbi:MAG: class I SAM-dependent methyltransferase, partial [Actinobacteria bacterium]|nr:class I SAM-dependent methyltransferase [Actinomycetota bacterium]